MYMLTVSCLVTIIAPLAMPPTPTLPPPTPTELTVTLGHAVTSVRADVRWVGPSQTFHLIVSIKPDDGWHVYWKNPGASGAPTEVEVSAPEGFQIGDAKYPRPSTFTGEEGLTYGYAEEAAIYIPVTSPASIERDNYMFEITTFWLACKQKCVMGEQSHELVLSSNQTQRGPKYRDMQLRRWESQLPKALSKDPNGQALVVGNTLHVSATSKESFVQFIGVEVKGIRFGAQDELVRNGDLIRLPIPIITDFGATEGEPITIEGILLVGRKKTDPSFVIRVTLEPDLHQ